MRASARLVTAGAIAAVVTATAAQKVCIQLRVHAQGTSAPLLQPTGQSAVGRATAMLTDPNRTMPDSNGPRRLMVHVWYPTSQTSGPTLPYMPDLCPARGVLTNDEVSVLQSVRTHVRETPLKLQTQSRFPALLFSHGDQMNGFLYSNFHEDLASHGYIVIAVDHPAQALFVAYPDRTAVSYSESGRPSPTDPQYASVFPRYLRARLSARESDLRFVLGHLSDIEVAGRRLTTVLSGRTAAFGHSSGGLAATLLCQPPAVVDACVNMDGRLDAAPYAIGFGKAPPAKPFLYVSKPFRTLTAAELKREGLTTDQAARSRVESNEQDLRLLGSAGPPAYRTIIQGADHNSFSDEPLLRNPSGATNVKLTEIVRELLRQFFDATFSTDSSKPFEVRNPDVQFEVVAPRP